LPIALTRSRFVLTSERGYHRDSPVPLRPEIRFCTTPDAVKLAVGSYGNGTPLLRAATWLTHVEHDATSPLTRHWCEELSRFNRYIVYDGRGCGLSDRSPTDVSPDAWLSDLETVADELGLARFPLLGMSMGAPIAIAYAVKHPERVSRLLLFGGFHRTYFSSKNPDPRVREEADVLLKSARLGWGTGSPALRQVFAAKLMGEATEAQRQAFDERQRESSSPEMAERYLRAMFALDVKDVAPRVACPTLVFHSRGDQLILFDQGRKLAALIPGARFVPLDSKNHIPFADEPAWHTFVAEARPFLAADGAGAAPPAGPALTSRQLEVLRAVARGLTDKEIARELSLSPRTVEMHVARILAALQCANRAQAVGKAKGLGILD
jgi:pimeloyl-ACP methyl ester carboxylesterase/DNA-binding CsgD family transcriptional regulator